MGYSWSNASASWLVYNESYYPANELGDPATINAGEVDYTFVGDAVANASLDNTWLGEVGVGCGSGSRGLRGEVMFGLRGKRDFDGEPTQYQDSLIGTPLGVMPPVTDDPMHT